jgi:DNA adenine methylase
MPCRVFPWKSAKGRLGRGNWERPIESYGGDAVSAGRELFLALLFLAQGASNAPVPEKRDKTQLQLDLSAGPRSSEPSYARPFLKWAGGKTQLLAQLAVFYPPRGTVKRYVEPFLGSGAVFFHFKAMVEPARALLWDNNRELVDTFQAVQQDVDHVIKLLRKHQKQHSKEFFLSMREKSPTSIAGKAARLIYLNKTCFNGLYRVNSRGIFNVPFGRYHNPSLFNEESLRQAALQLRGAKVESRDFRLLAVQAKKGDFVYFDPPYHPRSSTSSFTAYTRDSFGESDQRELAELYRKLDKKGCYLLLSNSDTPLVRELYAKFHIREVSARRNINSKADRRGPVGELVVLNHKLVEACSGRG